MAKGKGNVKGLYLEIGGDADGLKTALSDVNKSIAQTSGELKGINRLLKLDPKNTELLAQKQEVLNENIAATESKLQTLKNAKEKCDADMANGTEVNAAQYRDLQREIIYTENRLKKLKSDGNGSFGDGVKRSVKEIDDELKNTGKELKEVSRLLKLDPNNTVLLKQKQELLNKSVSDTKAKLKELKAEKKQCDADMKKGTEVNSEEYRQLQRDIIETKDSLKELKKEAHSSSSVLGTQIKSAGESISGIGEKFLPVTAAMTGAATAAIGAAEATREYREDMSRLESAFVSSNKTVDDAHMVYDGFYQILGESDRSVEAVSHLAKLTNSAEELAAWTDICAGVATTFGDSLPIEGLTEAANETAKVGEVTGPLADALNWVGISEDDFNAKLAACNSEKERSELITKTLSDVYRDAGNTFRESNADVMASRDAAQRLNDAMAELGARVEPIITQVKMRLAELAEWFLSLDESTQNRILIIAGIVAAIGPALIIIGKIATGVSTVISVLKTLSSVFTVIKTGFTIVKTAAMAFNAVLAANPIGLIITLVVAIGAALVTLYQKCEWFRNGVNSIVNFIKTNWKELATILINPFVGLFNLLYKLNPKFRQWVDNTVGSIKNGFNKMLEFIKTNWKELATILVNPFVGLFNLLYKLNPKFRQWVDNTVGSIKNGFNKMFEVGGHIITGLWNGISDKVEWLKSKVRGVVDKIKSWFTGKEGFDEHSPSKWAKKVSDFLMEGLANGVNENMSVEEAFKTKIANIKEFVTSNLSDIEAEYIQKQQSFAGKLKTADLYSKTSITFSGFGADGGDETIEDIELTDWNNPIAEMAAYADKLLALENRLQTTDIDDGIRDDFLELVRNMGYEGQDYIDKLLSVDTGKFDEYMQGYQIYQKEAELAASATYAKEAQRLEDDFLGTVTGSLDTIVQKFGEGGKNSAQEFGSKFNAEMDSIMSEINRRISSIRATINDARTSLNSMARNYTTNNNNSRNYSVTINNKGGSNSSAYEQHRQVNKLFNKLDLEGAL